jgi:predicted Zn finger-like uncharacterized protein
MDVRCDRCQTEYELDDASVAGSGASVQCTNCGHTFVVGSERPSGTPPPLAGKPGAANNPTPSWMLTTEEGKTHRFRDSQTLQKWVVERRVTRADRVCPPGGSWRRLADVDELRPFFDVVAQADRAAAAARGSRPTRPETPRASAPSRPYVTADVDDDDILTGGKMRRSAVSAPYAPMTSDDLAAAGLGSSHPGRKILIGVVVIGVAAAAYLGFKGTGGLHLPGSAPAAPAPASVPAVAPSAPAPAAPTAAAPAAPAPVAPTAPAPAAAAPAAPAPVAAAPPPPAPPPAPVPAAAPAAPAPAHEAAAAGEGRPKSYEHLVADADHALENGQTAKAQKLYDEALKLQPNGVEAVAGSAYVLLDKEKPLAAIDSFRRALGVAPSFGPALFGLGEAYRHEGQPVQAIAAYKKYLDASPGGPYATAARRQVRELESQAPASAPSRPTDLPPPAPTEPPPAQ